MFNPQDVDSILLGIGVLATVPTMLLSVHYALEKDAYTRLKENNCIKEIPEDLKSFGSYLRALVNAPSE